MNRRGFFGALSGLGGALLLPEPRRVYSFPSVGELDTLAFERALELSARTGVPVPPGVWRLSRTARVPQGFWLDGSVVDYTRVGNGVAIECVGEPKLTIVARCYFSGPSDTAQLDWSRPSPTRDLRLCWLNPEVAS